MSKPRRRPSQPKLPAGFAFREVANPYAAVQPAHPTLTVVVRTSGDTLASLLARGRIDGAQFAAGMTFRGAHETMEIGGAKAIDYSAVKVDGGRMTDPLTSDAYARASQRLRGAREALGRRGYALVELIAAVGHSVEDAALMTEWTVAHGLSRDDIKRVGWRFRECLDDLAELWGLATRDGRAA